LLKRYHQGIPVVLELLLHLVLVLQARVKHLLIDVIVYVLGIILIRVVGNLVHLVKLMVVRLYHTIFCH